MHVCLTTSVMTDTLGGYRTEQDGDFITGNPLIEDVQPPQWVEEAKSKEFDASLARYSAKRAKGERDRLLFSGPRGEGGLNRNNIAVWTSYDEGRSFTNPVQFNSGFAAYSVVQRLADGSVGLAVETAKEEGVRYGEISFYRFEMTELEDQVRAP